MFPYHIETKLLHGTDVINQRLVGGRGIKTVRPIALIQHAMKEKRSMVQAKAHDSLFVRFYSKGAHSEIAFHGVAAELYF